MEIVKIKIKDLTPYENNAKLHPKEQIEQIKLSIQKYSMCDPIGVWGEKNIIVEGHGRYLALKELGLVHNKTTMDTGFDLDLLVPELAELDLSDFDFDFGIDDEEEEPEIVEDEAPEVDEDAEPITKLGDIWQLGRHRLMCGDSTSIEDVEKLMRGQLADMLLTDPPYNVAYEGKTKDRLTIKNDSMDNDSFRQFLRDAFSSADAVMKQGAVFYIWHADSEGYNFRGACFDIGWKVRQCLIWNKNSMVMGRQDYQWKH